MKQLVRSARNGEILIQDVPAPAPKSGFVTVRTAASVLSAGTERAAAEFSEKGLLAKARARPDLVRQVIDRARRDGIGSAMEAVWNRLDEPMLIGYSSSGTVLSAGEGVTGFQAGDRVACAGGGYAAHAQVVAVPANLVAQIPGVGTHSSPVSFEEAAFATLGSIALHGIRLAGVKLGETVVVIGLGLVGQLTVQLAKGAGCRVIGMDIQPERAQLAVRLGADAGATQPEELRALCLQLTNGIGPDAVLITASSPSSEPVVWAGEIARERAAVVAVGTVGLSIPRRIYYQKELRLFISRSYGPGRYDSAYEEQGHDYPVGYVRWTENRNMQAFLQLQAERKVNVQPLITHRFSFDDAGKAYDLISGKTREPFLGIVLQYSQEPDLARRIVVEPTHKSSHAAPHRSKASPATKVSVGLLGAGIFVRNTLAPLLKTLDGIELVGVCASSGVSARYCADKCHFGYCTTDENEILNDPGVNTVIIATRNNLHGRQTVAALNSGKHVFVEKPLALNEEELREVEDAVRAHPGQLLSVGFNRRFAPLAIRLKSFFAPVREPLFVQYRVNAGYLPPDHWTQNLSQSGGRIIGEACHFIDFVNWLVGDISRSAQAVALPDSGRYQQDNVVITLGYPNGSVGTIAYLANGDRSLRKERIEVHGGGRSAVLEDFQRLEYGVGGRMEVSRRWLRQDKGHCGEFQAFVQAILRGGPPPISLDELSAATRATFLVAESLRGTVSLLKKPEGKE